MLDYLIKEIEEKMDDLLTFSDDVPSVEAAAKVQMEHLSVELNKMRSHLTQVWKRKRKTRGKKETSIT
jgi:hypothetical protein